MLVVWPLPWTWWRDWRPSSPRCCRTWMSGSGGWRWARGGGRWATAGSSRGRERSGGGVFPGAAGVGGGGAGPGPLVGARRPGGGRKKLAVTDPGLKAALLALVEPSSRGDPESPLRWTTRSLRNLAAELGRAGHRASAPTVAGLLREEHFSLQGNARAAEGRQHPDRDAQFRHISEQARAHQAAGQPVVSVDAKKKENVGNFKNGGREWRPGGGPEPVNVHDF